MYIKYFDYMECIIDLIYFKLFWITYIKHYIKLLA